MIKLSKPYIPDIAFEKALEVMRSGNLVQGAYVLKFEEELKKYLGSKHVIVVSSGTAALHLSLLALGIGPGDEVIIPSFTFPATANVVELVGAKPVFIDITIDDYCIDVSRIESAITPKTRVIMPVHEFGQSAGMDEIIALCKKYHLSLVEDAACALGSEYNGKKAGTFGEFGCYSFHPRKAVTTGEGGAVVTEDDELARKVRSLRNHGIEIINQKVEFNFAGLNYRMTDFQAVLGYFQMLEIEEFILERMTLAGFYDQKLAGIPEIIIPEKIPGRKNVYQSYHILLDSRLNRDDVKKQLLEKGIETNYGANALGILNFYKEKYDLKEGAYPISELAFTQGLALPLSHYLTEDDINHVCSSLIEICNGR
ncbi:MAG: DegT/DnrJ/EryC1/StrS family aminotransferase [Bacteroidota bacterium]